GTLTVDGEPQPYTDPYAAVADEVARYRLAPAPDLPPFAGGAVGMFGYDLVRTFEPSVGPAKPDELGLPDLAVMVSHVMLAFDHLTHRVTVLAGVFTREYDIDHAYDQAVAAIAGVRERLAAPTPRADAGPRVPQTWESNIGGDGYTAAVERIKEHIRAGDAYQVVPSQRWSADAPIDAFSLYRGLRTVNPSPYMYFLDFEDFQIAGASPESLVKVNGRRDEPRPVRRRRRLPVVHRRPRHLHLHPLRARQGRPHARAGRRRDRGGLGARLRGAGDRGEGERDLRGGGARLPSARLGVGDRHRMRVLLIDNYDSFAYNLVQYLGE